MQRYVVPRHDELPHSGGRLHLAAQPPAKMAPSVAAIRELRIKLFIPFSGI